MRPSLGVGHDMMMMVAWSICRRRCQQLLSINMDSTCFLFLNIAVTTAEGTARQMTMLMSFYPESNFLNHMKATIALSYCCRRIMISDHISTLSLQILIIIIQRQEIETPVESTVVSPTFWQAGTTLSPQSSFSALLILLQALCHAGALTFCYYIIYWRS